MYEHSRLWIASIMAKPLQTQALLYAAGTLLGRNGPGLHFLRLWGMSPRASDGDRRVTLGLSDAQQRLWLLDRLEPGNPSFNLAASTRLTVRLDIRALERAVNEVAQRHESLRTTFPVIDGEPRQVIQPSLIVPLRFVDLTGLPHADRQPEAARLTDDEAQHSFDLAAGPLIRALLLGLAAADFLFTVTMHHIVSDDSSMRVFSHEVRVLYTAFASGESSPLPDVHLQYAHFVEWQERSLSEALETRRTYWKRQLADLPALQLPTDHPHAELSTYRRAYHSFTVPAPLTAKLRALGERERANLFATMLAALFVLLYRYTNQGDIAVGTASANRTDEKTVGVIGLLRNTLVLRTHLSAEGTFRDLLMQVQQVVVDGYANELPFERVVNDVQSERDTSRHPLVQVAFQMLAPPSAAERVPTQDFHEFDLRARTAGSDFDLVLHINESGDGLGGGIEYNRHLFTAATIEGIVGHFQTLLEAIVSQPDEKLARLALLTAAEREQMLETWNATYADYPKHRCIHQLFEAEAARLPSATAVSLGPDHLTYGELNRRANQLAHHLRDLGVGPEVIVAMAVERSCEMVVGLLAILKAGGAYLPLDPAYPRDRLAFMLEDSQAPVMVTTRPVIGRLPPYTGRIVCLDTDSAKIALASTENPVGRAAATSLAYLIYTSGSTGKPKGVLGTHRNAVNRFSWMWRSYPFRAHEVCCQKTAVSFVDSIWEIFGPLLSGIPLVVIPDHVSKDPGRLIQTLASHHVTRIVLVPSLLRAILDTESDLASRLPQLEYVVSSGETLPIELARRLREALPHAALLNLYGSSEVAADATYHEVRETSSLKSVPIGRPIANTQTYILNPSLELAPVGVSGELHIGGDGVARGYLNRPDLTADKFLPHPFSSDPDARLYRTGDLARYLSDGTIEYLGRLDNQVKLRGYRIELGEVEAVLGEHPSVHEAVVVARDDADRGTHLVAYVVGRDENTDGASFRRFLADKLPDYMIPSAFVSLDALPQTPGGKVDRSRLPAPAHDHTEHQRQRVAPRDPVELQLAALWERILGVRGVGVTDNFFDLGGHSLLAVNLLIQIEQIFEKTLDLATLLRAPTIEQLAGELRQDESEHGSSALVPLRTGGSHPAFYCVGGDDGSVLRFRGLAECLSPDQPVYGLQAPGLDSRQAPYTRIEAMASHYVREVRRFQPDGPYYVGGYCAGGLVALEMAHQFQSDGQEVGLVAMFETSAPRLMVSLPRAVRLRYQAHMLRWRLNANLRKLAPLGATGRLRYVGGKMRRLALRFTRLVATKVKRAVAGDGHDDTSIRFERRLLDNLETVRHASLIAEREYRPKRFDGRIAHFVVHYSGIVRTRDIQRGWDTIVRGGVELHEVPGDHHTMFSKPHVEMLAKELRKSLDEARARQRGQQHAVAS